MPPSSGLEGPTSYLRNECAQPWATSERELQQLNSQFGFYHDKGEKNLTDAERDTLKALRARCVEVGASRYAMLITPKRT